MLRARNAGGRERSLLEPVAASTLLLWTRKGRAPIMDEVLVSLRNISKRFGRFEALKSVNLDIERGGIYGLIGENGAGKSTLIRIVNGLTLPTSGQLAVFGHTKPDDIRRSRSRIGYMPDVNASYPNLSASDNLLVRCTEWGVPQTGVEEILDLVGLGSAGRKRAGSFSMGMKRRLDLAIALLGDPDLLILDEPTNGLDPMGIVEVRKMLADLNTRLGKTILVSSHNLEELHKLATHFAFISHGRLLLSTTAAEIEKGCGKSLVLRVGEPRRALMELESHAILSVRIEGDALRIEDCRESSAAIVGMLAGAGISVHEVFTEQQSLEDYYANLIAHGGDQ